jgi:hypothetical protein
MDVFVDHLAQARVLLAHGERAAASSGHGITVTTPPNL